MTTGRFEEQLSELQQRILKHFFRCQDKTESVSHISKEISALQPAVFRSIQSLIEDGYITKEKKSTSGEKLLALTDKGAARALLLGASYDKVENYLKETKLASGLQILVELFKEQENRDLLLKKGAQFLLDRRWIHKPTLEDKDKMQLIVFLLSDSRIREGFNWKDEDIIELVETFHLNIRLLLTVLQEKQRIISTLTDKLRSRLDKSEKAPRSEPWGALDYITPGNSSHEEKRIKVRR